MAPPAMALLLRSTLLFLYLTSSSCQQDCTGVDCPPLDHCIEEVLESGSCCTSCLQKGCTCEGYQYYDCINAGFKNGKVPEGNFYFVDYGSTECSCPAGGGRISCHFISCPDVPPNCIEVSEPADGCVQCERVGCVHGGQKYEAGHSFHIDHCEVCHCPNDGGELMCYAVPDCDPQEVHKPVVTAPSGEETANRGDPYPYMFNQRGHMDQLPTTFHQHPHGNEPLFKSPPLDKNEEDDYDYGPTDLPETVLHSLLIPTQSPSTHKATFGSRGESQRTSALQSLDRSRKLELIERLGVHDHPADKEEETENPWSEEQGTVRPPSDQDTTTSWQRSQDLTGLQSVSVDDQSQTESEDPLPAHRTVGSATFPLNPDLGGKKRPKNHHWGSESAAHHPVTDNVIQSQISDHPRGTEREEQSDRDREQGVDEEGVEEETEPEGLDVSYKITQQDRSDPTRGYEKTTLEPSTSSPTGPEGHTTPVVHFLPTATTQLPVRVELGESPPSRKPPRLLNVSSEDEEAIEEEERRGHPDGGKSRTVFTEENL